MDRSNLHFVISAPRSGSTWLATALNHHPEIFATEHRLFGRYCEVWPNQDGTHSPVLTFDSYVRSVAGHYFSEFAGLDRTEFISEFQKEYADFLVQFALKRTGKKLVIDKITPYPDTAHFVTRQIRELFPDSKLIQLIRDGRDVLTSGAFDWLLRDAAGTERFEFFVRKNPAVKLKRFFDDQIIAKWASHWVETINAFRKIPNHVCVTYEEMQNDFVAAMESVCEGLGVDASPELLKICKSKASFKNLTGRSAGDADPLAKARRGVVGDWKNYFTKPDGELFDSLAGKELIECSYELDRSWIDKLPDELGSS